MVKFFHIPEKFSFSVKIFAWLLVLLLLFEIFTRNFVMKFPSEYFVQGLGNVAEENSITVNGMEGFGVTHYLANGEIVTPYQSGVSVVVLGDSFTEATQVNDNEKYVSIAEEKLHEHGVKMDLHNLGYSGRSLPDYVYMAPFIKKIYSPTIVVVQLNLLDFVESFDDTKENYFVRNGTSVRLMRNENFSSNQLILRNLIRSTSLGSLIRYKFKSINLVPERQLRSVAAGITDADVTALGKSSFNPNDVKMQIDALRDAYSDVELALLIIPEVPVLQETTLIWHLETEDTLMKMLEGFPHPDLIYPRDKFMELYTTQGKFPRGFFNTLPNSNGHLNSDGNFVVGVDLADYLEGIAK